MPAPSRSCTCSTRSPRARSAACRGWRRRWSGCGCSTSTTTPSSTGRRSRRCSRASSPDPGRTTLMGEDSAQKDADGIARASAARHHAAAAAGRGHQVLGAGRMWAAATRRSSTALLACCSAADGHALHQRDRRSAPGELRACARASSSSAVASSSSSTARWCIQLCRPVWQRWLATAVLTGALDLPGFAENPGAGCRSSGSRRVGLGRSAQGPQGRDRGRSRPASSPAPT